MKQSHERKLTGFGFADIKRTYFFKMSTLPLPHACSVMVLFQPPLFHSNFSFLHMFIAVLCFALQQKKLAQKFHRNRYKESLKAVHSIRYIVLKSTPFYILFTSTSCPWKIYVTLLRRCAFASPSFRVAIFDKTDLVVMETHGTYCSEFCVCCTLHTS